MANEKNVAVRADLEKAVKFRRRKFEIENNDGTVTVGEYIECTTVMRGESIRFKVDPKDTKLVRMLMRMYGYPLYDVDGVSVVHEEPMSDEL